MKSRKQLDQEIVAMEALVRRYPLEEKDSLLATSYRMYLNGLKRARELIFPRRRPI